MGRENKLTGILGEDAASSFLKKRGYRILKRNFRTPFGELDIVAKYGGMLVFVEVKTRISDSLGPPYLAITRQKKRHLIKNAYAYLKRFCLMDSCWRIDIVSVKMKNNYEVENIELFENAVEEEY